MIKASITREESILNNLDTWCYERGDRFEQSSIEAAQDCVRYINSLGFDHHILDLGCGDGAATKEFFELGFNTLAVDINPEKLERVPGLKFESDIVEFTEKIKIFNNIFSHHAFEHVVNIEEAIKNIGKKIQPGCLYYVIVPANDYLHSVHHVVFESPEELLPPGLTPLKMEYQERAEPEFICVAQKLS